MAERTRPARPSVRSLAATTPSIMSASTALRERPRILTATRGDPGRRRIDLSRSDRPGGLENTGTTRSRRRAAQASERAAFAKSSVVISMTAIFARGCDISVKTTASKRTDQTAGFEVAAEMSDDNLNAAQRETLKLLGADATQRPHFELELRDELRTRLETRLEPLVEVIDSDEFAEDDLYLSKYKLSQVLGCERRFLATRDEPFEWSPPIARGTLAHKAIELSINWRDEAVPQELVDAAISRLENSDDNISAYLQGCGQAERSELRSAAGAAVEQFQECFPRLKAAWRPTTESPIRASLHDGRIVLSGKPDLTLGQPSGTQAGKVIIDFKTGGFSPSHAEDMRFYALVEALRVLPPRLVATYYLDEARAHVENVNLNLLDSALERVVDAALRYVELVSAKRAAGVAAGPACRWCPVLDDCDTGNAYVHGESEHDFDYR